MMNKNTKQLLREQAKDVRATIPENQKLLDAEQLKHNVLKIISDDISHVGTYYPIGMEIIPPHELANIGIALPVIRNKTTLEFYRWAVGEPLVKRDFDIPIPDTRELEPITPDIILLPLLLCDKHGNRIGYGAGHYDRYIASCETKPLLVGICFDEQVYDGDIPAESHDMPLDLIVTPKRIIKIA